MMTVPDNLIEAAPNRNPTMRRRSGSLDDDEISLIDVWNTLVRRRFIVGILFLATTAAGAVWLALSSVNSEPEYEARATIRSALVANVVYSAPTGWEDTFVARHELSRYEALTTVTLTTELPGARATSRNVAVTSDIRINGRSTETVESDLATAIAELLAMQTAWYETERETLQRRHDLAQRVYAHFDALMSEGHTGAVGATESGNRAPITVEALTQLPELYERASILGRMLDEPYTRPAEVIAPVMVTEASNGTRPAIVIVITLILSAMTGVFGALFAEFIDNARKARELENS
jgi:hypothetical protein